VDRFVLFRLAIALSVLLQFSLVSSNFLEKGVKQQEIFAYPFEDSVMSHPIGDIIGTLKPLLLPVLTVY
jgi:hypothetical protein